LEFETYGSGALKSTCCVAPSRNSTVDSRVFLLSIQAFRT
jgi:hypothetical protein